MHKSDRLSLRAFGDQLETQLEPLLARAVEGRGSASRADERGTFLAQLVPERKSAAILLFAKAEPLVPDVLALKKRYTADRTAPGHHYRARRDDNRNFQGAYGKYGPELEGLFERARAVLNWKSLH